MSTAQGGGCPNEAFVPLRALFISKLQAATPEALGGQGPYSDTPSPCYTDVSSFLHRFPGIPPSRYTCRSRFPGVSMRCQGIALPPKGPCCTCRASAAWGVAREALTSQRCRATSGYSSCTCVALHYATLNACHPDRNCQKLCETQPWDLRSTSKATSLAAKRGGT